MSPGAMGQTCRQGQPHHPVPGSGTKGEQVVDQLDVVAGRQGVVQGLDRMTDAGARAVQWPGVEGDFHCTHPPGRLSLAP